ncbi:MAG: amidohydrolase family protein [Nitrososphaerota archaeon]|nr:amidohydrolase family protein [Nitrososphaerota archaeon]
MKLVIRHARTLEHEGQVDIAADDGIVSGVKADMSETGEYEIDAGGNLVLPTFVEPHVHLDKAFLAESMPEAGSMAEARRLVKDAKSNFTGEDVAARAQRCLESALLNGVTAVRTHVDIDGVTGLKSLRAMSGLKAKYKGLLELQVVAFPQEGIVKENGAGELLEKAMENGADLVGGLPEAELTEEDGRAHVDRAFEIASKYHTDIDVHCDVQPHTKFVEYYASGVIRRGYGRRATADHLIALAYYDDDHASKIVGMLRSAGMNVVTNPCTMMVSGSSDRPPKGRGITRVKELLGAGVNVSFGLDNVMDPYNPFGDFEPLRNGWLLSYGGQLNRAEDQRTVLRMATYNAARVLGLDGYGLAPGCRADINVLDAPSPRESLRRRTIPRYVIKAGRVLVENSVTVKKNF